MDKELEKQCMEALAEWENDRHKSTYTAGWTLYNALADLLQLAQGA